MVTISEEVFLYIPKEVRIYSWLSGTFGTEKRVIFYVGCPESEFSQRSSIKMLT